jgi:NADPH:quinone reductase-like Zn-dependent oxidoreductase
MLPLILGRDLSGEVVATGSAASRFAAGAHVFGALSPVAPTGTAVQVDSIKTRVDSAYGFSA